MLARITGSLVAVLVIMSSMGGCGSSTSPTGNKGTDTTTKPSASLVRQVLGVGDTLMTMNKEQGIGDTQYIGAYKAVFAARNADPHFVDTLKANGSNGDLATDISEWSKYVGGGVIFDSTYEAFYMLDSVARATVDTSPILAAGRLQYGLWTRETSPTIIITSDSTAILNTNTGGYKENPPVFHLFYDACQTYEIEGPPSQSKLNYSIDSATYEVHFTVDTLAWKIPLVSFANLVDSTNTPYTFPLMNTYCNVLTSHAWVVKKVGSKNRLCETALKGAYDVPFNFFN